MAKKAPEQKQLISKTVGGEIVTDITINKDGSISGKIGSVEFSWHKDGQRNETYKCDRDLDLKTINK